MPSWRTLIGGSLTVAVVTLGAVIADVGATTATVSSFAVHEPTPATAPPPDLGPVTETAVDPAVLAATRHAGPGGASITQRVELTVLGGPLELRTTELEIALDRVPGTDRDWVATLPPVRIVDARGTHDGWDVRWGLEALEADGQDARARVSLEPSQPAVVAGVADGVMAGGPASAGERGHTLFSAISGGGAGTYEASGIVRVQAPAGTDDVVVRLAFWVG